jgi:hypothetical protein
VVVAVELQAETVVGTSGVVAGKLVETVVGMSGVVAER